MLSLETCLKLRESGWKQDTTVDGMFYFQNGPSTDLWHTDTLHEMGVCESRIVANCPSLEELLEALLRFPLESLMQFQEEGVVTLEWCGGVRDEGPWAWEASLRYLNHDYVIRDGNSTEAVAGLWLGLRKSNG